MDNRVEIRFRVPRNPFTIIAAAAEMHGMSVTAFVMHAVQNELKRSGDYARLTANVAPIVVEKVSARPHVVTE